MEALVISNPHVTAKTTSADVWLSRHIGKEMLTNGGGTSPPGSGDQWCSSNVASLPLALYGSEEGYFKDAKARRHR